MRQFPLQARVAGCPLSAAPHAAALQLPACPAPGDAAAAGAAAGAAGAAAARTLFAWSLPASPHLAVQREGVHQSLFSPPSFVLIQGLPGKCMLLGGCHQLGTPTATQGRMCA